MVKGPFEWANFCALCDNHQIVSLKCWKIAQRNSLTCNDEPALGIGFSIERGRRMCRLADRPSTPWDPYRISLERFYRSQLNQFVKLLSHRYFQLWCWYRCCGFWYPLQLCDDARGPLKDTLGLSHAEREKKTNNTHSHRQSVSNTF